MAENYDEMTDRMTDASERLLMLGRFENAVDIYGNSPDAAGALNVLRNIANRSKFSFPELGPDKEVLDRDSLKRSISAERDDIQRSISGKVGEQQRRDVEEAMKPQEERLPDVLPPNVTDAKK